LEIQLKGISFEFLPWSLVTENQRKLNLLSFQDPLMSRGLLNELCG